MNQKTMVPLVVIVLIGLGLIWYIYTMNGQKKVDNSATPTVTETIGPNTVVMNNFAFSPNTMTVPVGTTVTWVNKESSVHDVRSSLFTSPSMQENDKFSYTFSQPGTYDYSCGFHPTMTGKIIVQ